MSLKPLNHRKRKWFEKRLQKKQPKKQTASAREKALEKQIKQLQKEKKELEKSLKWEEIKSQLFEKMVEVAERELDLPIRKKFGTKQFEK